MTKEGKEEGKPQSSRSAMRGINFWVVVILFGLLIAWIWVALGTPGVSQINYSYFEKLVQGKDFDGKPLYLDEHGVPIEQSAVEFVELGTQTAIGRFRDPPPPPAPIDGKTGKRIELEEGQRLKEQFTVNIDPPDSAQRAQLEALLNTYKVTYDKAKPSNWTGLYLGFIIIFSIGILLLMFFTLRRAQNQMIGGGGFLSNFSRSPAKRYEPSAQPITFKDVAGLQGVKADLLEIVEFLREPEKFQRLGGRVPKGVLLVGPPGTGKTLLARAVAGEANVPFYSVNGSEFIQMFVGVGASRVRDLFNTAKANAPSIIFIDEIDAVGRQRGAGLGGGHDEREQTLNQILGEMDGFHANDSAIVVAATNRPDVLDPALLRPGRFDRHITVTRPTQIGRLEIFKVHVRDVPLAKDVDLKTLAQATAGMTGADIQNMVNEAALWAARHDKTKVEMDDFHYAHDKVLMGARREEILTEKEKERTAVHEAGHTLAAWFLKGAHPVHKVTVIPRGQSLGVTQMVPEEDRMNISENELRDQLVVLLSGRAAEKLTFDEFTVGAENDLERATLIARRMVTHWGMSDRLGPVSYKISEEDPFLGREIHQNRHFSEHTMEIIDEEVAKILQDSSQKALNLLTDRRGQMEMLAERLRADEELDRQQIRELIGPSVHETDDAKEEDGADRKTTKPGKKSVVTDAAARPFKDVDS